MMNDTWMRIVFSYPYGLFTASAVLWCLLFPVAKAPSNIAAVLITSIVLFCIARRKISLPPLFKNRTMGAALLLLLMPLFWYGHPGFGHYGAYAKDALFALYMLAMACWIRQYQLYVHRVLHALLIGVVFTASVSLLQYGSILPMKDGAAVGLHNGTMTGAFSLLLVFACSLLSYLIRQEKLRRVRILLSAGFLLCLTDLFLVIPGRTGYLAFAVLGSFIMYNMYKSSRALSLSFLLVVILMVLNSSVFMQRIAMGRTDITQYSSGVSSTSLGARFEMWKVSWRNFKEQPLLGAGTNSFSSRWMAEGYKKVPYAFNNPHSTYFHLLGNYGLVGFSILLLFIWRLAVTAWYNRSSLAGVSVACFLVIFVVGSLTNTMVTSDFYLTWLAIMSGIASGLPDMRDINGQTVDLNSNKETLTSFGV